LGPERKANPAAALAAWFEVSEESTVLDSAQGCSTKQGAFHVYSRLSKKSQRGSKRAIVRRLRRLNRTERARARIRAGTATSFHRPAFEHRHLVAHCSRSARSERSCPRSSRGIRHGSAAEGPRGAAGSGRSIPAVCKTISGPRPEIDRDGLLGPNSDRNGSRALSDQLRKTTGRARPPSEARPSPRKLSEKRTPEV